VKIEWDNKSHLTEETIREVVHFLAARCADVKKTVRLTLVARPNGRGIWGRAFWPLQRGGLRRGSRTRKWGTHSVRVYVGVHPLAYPFTETYKKRAGPMTYHNEVEVFVHLLAHELHHIEQFHQTELCYPGWRKLWNFKSAFKKWEKMLPYASSEVQAELRAHAHLEAWRTRGIVPSSAVNEPEREPM
jgi:hypothetical protein